MPILFTKKEALAPRAFARKKQERIIAITQKAAFLYYIKFSLFFLYSTPASNGHPSLVAHLLIILQVSVQTPFHL